VRNVCLENIANVKNLKGEKITEEKE